MLDIEHLIKRPVLRSDQDHEMFNKMTDDEIEEFNKSTKDSMIKDNVDRKKWGMEFMMRTIDICTLYDIYKLDIYSKL